MYRMCLYTVLHAYIEGTEHVLLKKRIYTVMLAKNLYLENTLKRKDITVVEMKVKLS